MTTMIEHDDVREDPGEGRSGRGADGDPTGGHPFPQLRRPNWVDLRGVWRFAYDDADAGVTERWQQRDDLDRDILVPYPPEAALSGIGDNGYHPVVWYLRTLSSVELLEAGWRDVDDERLLLHFGAVDYHATVWFDGVLVGEHEGGHTPFVLDITDGVRSGTAPHRLVVRAEDHPLDVGKPRGKQEWLEDARDIWYDRTTGIWQTVWLESVPELHVRELAWVPSRACDAVRAELQLSRRPHPESTITVVIRYQGEELARQESRVDDSLQQVIGIELPRQRNGQHYDKLLWSPEHPRLLDVDVEVQSEKSVDFVESYLGLRTVAVRDRRFVLNDRPYFVRSVLEQGFWPDSHLAAPDDDALRDEVELIKSLGFNAARLHQKFEDPRFLYWADRLGLLVWGEAPAAYEFSIDAASRLVSEWTDIVRRDRSHPSLVTWVPLNESWGIQHVATDPAQRAFSRAIADLTRAFDPSRPVISNDGWEHTDSDILTVHDYDSPRAMADRYRDQQAIADLFAGYGPADRLMLAEGRADPRAAVMVTEFGGIRFTPAADSGSWGYSTASNASEFEAALRQTFDALQASSTLAGFCYTQLTDTMQEANGLTDAARTPKLPVSILRAIITGQSGDS